MKRKTLLFTFLFTVCSICAASLFILFSPKKAKVAHAAPTGFVESGIEITSAQFSDAEFMSPPPKDAQTFEVRHPLRNGTNVPVKKRWIWVPPGKSIVFKKTAGEAYEASFPVDTKIWKEFYVETDAGVFLVERRLLIKVDDDNEKNGHLNNGGWLFFTAHTLPETEWSMGDLFPWNMKSIELRDETFSSMLFKPDDWMPIQRKSASTHIVFSGQQTSESSYVFPGGTNCTYCHNGANAAFENKNEQNRILAFGIHPQNLTAASFQRLTETNTIRVEGGLDPEVETDALTEEVLGVFRNNCISCHTTDRKAAGYPTNFRLDPNYNYSMKELQKLLYVRAARFGTQAFPLVTPGEPEKSEIVLRMRGSKGRLRMPPLDGGVPEIDSELLALVEKWITAMPKQASQ